MTRRGSVSSPPTTDPTISSYTRAPSDPTVSDPSATVNPSSSLLNPAEMAAPRPPTSPVPTRVPSREAPAAAEAEAEDTVVAGDIALEVAGVLTAAAAAAGIAAAAAVVVERGATSVGSMGIWQGTVGVAEVAGPGGMAAAEAEAVAEAVAVDATIAGRTGTLRGSALAEVPAEVCGGILPELSCEGVTRQWSCWFHAVLFADVSPFQIMSFA